MTGVTGTWQVRHHRTNHTLELFGRFRGLRRLLTGTRSQQPGDLAERPDR